MTTRYLSDQEFFAIYSKVPRLNVDLIIKTDAGILMALRSIEPYLDHWHLPGGTVYKTETIEQAALRVAQTETGLTCRMVACHGYMEFPHEIRSGSTPETQNIDTHTVSIVIELAVVGGELRHDGNAKELIYVKELPPQTVTEHATFLTTRNFF
jgi:colanic acid biosynthesis protein WcaH